MRGIEWDEMRRDEMRWILWILITMLIDYFTRFQQTKIKEKKNNVKYNNKKNKVKSIWFLFICSFSFYCYYCCLSNGIWSFFLFIHLFYFYLILLHLFYRSSIRFHAMSIVNFNVLVWLFAHTFFIYSVRRHKKIIKKKDH